MAADTKISRREFLKWFAALSITSAGGVGCVCVPVALYGPPPEPEYGPPPITVQPEYGAPVVTEVPIVVEYGPPAVTNTPIAVEYGPPPVKSAEVMGIMYIDAEGLEQVLHESSDVPPSTQFVIYFSVPMAESSQDAVVFTDVGGEDVAFESEWMQEDVLAVALTVALDPGTDYVLEVGDGAVSVEGDPLVLTETAWARFTTAE
jgi:hypothetical protein